MSTTVGTAWEQVKLADIKVESNFKEVPAGDYTVQLLPGAQVRERNSGMNLSAQAAITDGEFKGMRIFLDYPDPSQPKMGWSLQALKKLEHVLGLDSIEGEDPVTYLNRAASNGHATFGITLAPGKPYVSTKTGETVTPIQPQLFSVRPAA